MKKIIFILIALLFTQTSYSQTPQYEFQSPVDPNDMNILRFYGILSGNIKKYQTIHRYVDFPGMPVQGVITDVYIQISNDVPAGKEVYGLLVEVGNTAVDSFKFISGQYHFLSGLHQTLRDTFRFTNPVDSGDWIKIPLSSPYSYDFGGEKPNLAVGVASDTGNFAPFNGPTVFMQQYNLNYTVVGTPHASPKPSTFLIGFDIQPVSVNNINHKRAMMIYPNPAKDKLHITNAQYGDSYMVSDITGKIMLQGKMKQEGYIEIQDLVPGLYIIKLGHQTMKFLKE